MYLPSPVKSVLSVSVLLNVVDMPGGQWYGSTSIATVFGDEKGPQSRPCSGRVSGLRGEMIRTSSADGRARPKKKEKAASTRQSRFLSPH